MKTKLPKFSAWMPAVTHHPATRGWYEVRHPKGDWTGGEAHAYWDGKEWHRCIGWPSSGNFDAWTIVNGRLKVASYGSEFRFHGEVRPGKLGAFKIVEPTEWRGFL